jgi:hypothetical protein
MIDNNTNMLFQKVEKYLINKHIYCDKNWLLERINLYVSSKNIETDIYKEVLSTDINTMIDKEKIGALNKLNDLANPNTVKVKLNKSLFLQINGYSNIAQPTYKPKEALIDVLDKEKNLESKFLVNIDEDKEKEKNEKSVFKLELSDGVGSIVGFEYEFIPGLETSLGKKFSKVMVLPDTEVRRGIIYLRKGTTNILT